MKEKEIVIFKCDVCGNISVKLVDSGVPMFCCGKPMTAIVPNTVDATSEKHKPVAKQDGTTLNVQVGEVLHPMTKEHYISMIILQTNKGVYVKNLSPLDQPMANFTLDKGEKPIAVLSYCNLHGLWK